jgi:sugar phosphate isomerase/epimerase
MPQLTPGLVSITFRQLAPPEVIDLVVKAGLNGIEWGGDIHVPHGDIARAKEVRHQTLEAGLSIAAYGSYYRLGVSETQGLSFARVLDSAVALGAPTIRLWAGNKGSAETSDAERNAVIADARRVADLAQRQGIVVSLEYHGGTLTDTRDSVRRLLGEISHPNLDFLWQPTNGEPAEACLARLHDVLPQVRHVHVFHWWPTAAERRPLAEGETSWLRYLDVIRRSGKTMPCLLEFVRDDSPEQFLRDAATLRRWLDPVTASVIGSGGDSVS